MPDTKKAEWIQLAIPFPKDNQDDSDYEETKCRLCGIICTPTHHGGCDRSNEKGCNWYIESHHQ